MSTPPPYVPVAIPKAPEGTPTNTLWIWLVVVLPIVQLIPLLFVNWGSLLDAASVTNVSGTAFITSPAYLLSTVGGWVVYGLVALCAYRDWKQLRMVGVPVPFHFAWVFLSSIVYAIGRSVVVKRRTGQGMAPMWIAIASVVLSFAVAIYITAVIIASMVATLRY